MRAEHGTLQACIRLLVSPISCRYTAAALYSGTVVSSSSTKRWLAGSFSAAAKRSFAAMSRLAEAHHVCDQFLSQGPGTGSRRLAIPLHIDQKSDRSAVHGLLSSCSAELCRRAAGGGAQARASVLSAILRP